jgi:hypothetical protein
MDHIAIFMPKHIGENDLFPKNRTDFNESFRG